MCSLTPSVTIYGTTQIPTVTTITHTVTSTGIGDPIVSQNVAQTVVCNAAGIDCEQQVVTLPITVIPTVTSTLFSVETKATFVTSVVPQQTLYYPCTFGASTTFIRDVTRSDMATSTKSRLEEAPTFQTPVSQPRTTTTSSEPTLSVAPSASTDSTLVTSMSLAATTTTFVAVTTTQTDKAARVTLSTKSTPTPSSSTPSIVVGSGVAAQGHDKGSRSKTGAIAGGVAGAVVALILLCSCIVYLRRAKAPSRRDSQGTVSTDYWERRFRALEAEEASDHGETKDLDISPDTPTAPPTAWGKKLRYTMNLQSERLSNRPASRLSTISAFFASKPQLAQQQVGKPYSSFNFSRPRFGHARQSSRSSKSTNVDRHRRGSFSTTRSSLKSASLWLQDSAKTRSAMPGSREGVRGAAAESSKVEARIAMEWIRPETVARKGSHDEAGTSPYAPATPSLPHLVPSPSSTGEHGAQGLEPQHLQPALAVSSDHPGITPRQLTSTNITKPSAYHLRRAAQGKPVPVLPLHQHAITPSLWVNEHAYQGGHTIEESRFSPDTTVPSATTSDDPYGGIASTTDDDSSVPQHYRMQPSPSAQSAGGSHGGYALERSAVTPQLPVILLNGGSGVDSWSDEGREERVRTIYND